MAIKNDKLGGTDWTEEKLTPTDLNATFDAALEVFNEEQVTFSIMMDTTHLTTTTSGGSVTDTVHGINIDVGTATDNATAATASFGPIGYNQNMKMRFLMPIEDHNVQDETHYVYGFSDNTDASSATKYIGIRITDAGAGTVVTAVSKDGSTEETTVITGSFGNTTGTETYRIIDFELVANTSAIISIDGAIVATHTTNFPPNADTTTNVVILAVEGNHGGGGTGGDFSIGPLTAKIAM